MSTFTIMATRQGVEQLIALVPLAGTARGRPVLTCIGFLAERAAATDSYVLGIVDVAPETETVGEAPLCWLGEVPDAGRRDLIVEAKPLKKALAGMKPSKVLRGAHVTLTFDTEERNVTLKGAETTTVLPLLDGGSFPDVNALLPAEPRNVGETVAWTPTLNVAFLARFTELAHKAGHAWDKALAKAPGATGASLVPYLNADESRVAAVEVRSLDGTTLGLIMPMRIS